MANPSGWEDACRVMIFSCLIALPFTRLEAQAAQFQKRLSSMLSKNASSKVGSLRQGT
jgi:hypothetical protein